MKKSKLNVIKHVATKQQLNRMQLAIFIFAQLLGKKQQQKNCMSVLTELNMTWQDWVYHTLSDFPRYVYEHHYHFLT